MAQAYLVHSFHAMNGLCRLDSLRMMHDMTSHMMPGPAGQEWFTPAEAAQFLPGVSVDALRRLIRLGRVAAKKNPLNHRYRIHRSELDRLREALDEQVLSVPSAGSAASTADVPPGQAMLSWPGAPTPPSVSPPAGGEG
ncbi:helix-turn-helix domain-containing protein [Actinomyces sp. zg296]|uniref:helix-turn-helix domain-containing protein n=1 Tax=Actinomyces sp. zg296 TaxID=2609289 RepID=UPI003FA467DA